MLRQYLKDNHCRLERRNHDYLYLLRSHSFQLGFNELSAEEQESLRDWMYDLLYELYENEERYTEELYDELGWTDEVKTFLRYNANKALMNLGQDPLFPDTANDVNPIVMNGISTGTSNHDFFSQVGNGYLALQQIIH